MGSTSRFSCHTPAVTPHMCSQAAFQPHDKGSRSPFLPPMEVSPRRALEQQHGCLGQAQPFWQGQWVIKHLVQMGVASLIFTQAGLYVLAAELVLQSPSTVPVLARILGCWQGLAGLFNQCSGCCLPHAIHSCSGSQSLNHLLFPMLLSQLFLR